MTLPVPTNLFWQPPGEREKVDARVTPGKVVAPVDLRRKSENWRTDFQHDFHFQ